jgi:hypothetical protein
MAGPGAVDDVLRAIAGQAEQPKYIRAYHGSPHDFDRFDASKIGTGEGAQSYGHGLYFAGNERVADGYRNKLSGSYLHALAEPADLENYFAPGNVVDGYGGKDKVLEFVRGPDGPWDWRVKVIRVDQTGAPLVGERPRYHSAVPNRAVVDRFFGREPRRPGHTYEVEIAHPEEALLDWDRPLKSQGALIGERLAPFRTDKYDLSPARGTDYETGATALHRIAGVFDDDMAEASAALREAGIPGIRYLDQGSRSAGQGTRNYVMFPGAEDSIRILRKYGLMAPIAAGAGQGGDGRH